MNIYNKIPVPAELAAGNGLWIDRSEGIPVCRFQAQRFYSVIYTFNTWEDTPWRDTVQMMYSEGVRLFSFLSALPLAWRTDGTFDFSELDELHDELVALVPDGLFMPRVFVTTPPWWDEKYPDELLGFSGSVPVIPPCIREHQRMWRMESKWHHGLSNADMASNLWRKDAGNALAAYVRHTTSKYPGHFIAYQVAYGTCGEWGDYGSFSHGQYGNSGFGKPTVNAYRKFLFEKYRSDEGLKSAWKRDDITLDNVLPPLKTTKHRTEYGCFKSPAFTREILDWCEISARIKYSAIDHFCGVVKNVQAPYKVLAGSFGAGCMGVGASAYGSHFHIADEMMKQLYNAKNIDYLATPNAYLDCVNGIHSQAPMKSLSRKILFIAECDVRTHLAQNMFPYGIVPENEEESLNNFLFNSGYNLSQGNGWLWWYDFGRGWYLLPEIKKSIKNIMALLSSEKVGNTKIQAEVALVISTESHALVENMSGYYRELRLMLNNELPAIRCGFDVILMRDVFEMAPYKLYIFGDAFYVKKPEKLRRFLIDNKASALWFHAAGAITPDKIDFNECEKLTGISVRPLADITAPNTINIKNGRHPFCENLSLPAVSHETDVITTNYTPLLYADEAVENDILGDIESVDLPGIVAKIGSERFDLWSALPHLPVLMLQNLCRYAGVKADVLPVPLLEEKNDTLLSCTNPKTVKECEVQYFRGHSMIVIRSRNAGGAKIKSHVPLKDLLEGVIFPSEYGICNVPLKKNQTRILLLRP